MRKVNGHQGTVCIEQLQTDMSAWEVVCHAGLSRSEGDYKETEHENIHLTNPLVTLGCL